MKKTGLALGCAALLGWMGWTEPVAETPAKWDLETQGECVSGELFERTPEDAAALRQLRAAFAKDGCFQADFSQKTRDIRPALHSSGWSPRLYPR